MTHVLAIVAIALALAGCRKSVAPACRQVCACSPCSGSDFDACVEKAETAQTNAEERGCERQFEAFLGCFEDTVSCVDSAAHTDRCSRVTQDLKVCADAGSPFVTVCEEAFEKIAACTDSPPKPGQLQCSGALACQLACVLRFDCDVLTGIKHDPAFDECNQSCSGVVNGPKP